MTRPAARLLATRNRRSCRSRDRAHGLELLSRATGPDSERGHTRGARLERKTPRCTPSGGPTVH